MLGKAVTYLRTSNALTIFRSSSLANCSPSSPSTLKIPFFHGWTRSLLKVQSSCRLVKHSPEDIDWSPQRRLNLTGSGVSRCSLFAMISDGKLPNVSGTWTTFSFALYTSSASTGGKSLTSDLHAQTRLVDGELKGRNATSST